MSSITVVSAGPLSLFQDSGRHGYRDIGVATAGAFDRRAFSSANLAVGNESNATVIECVLGGLELIANTDSIFAVSGAATELPQSTPIEVSASDRLNVGRARSGLRIYLAVAGGFEVEPVLGSASHDTMSKLGPPPVQPGDIVRVGSCDPVWGAGTGHNAPVARQVRVYGGPHADVVAGGLEGLLARGWSVSPRSSRIGVRLQTSDLVRVDVSIPSEPTLPGAIQLTPSGELIVLGPDGPTTGGYPVVGVVHDEDLDVFAQLRPGQTMGGLQVVD